MKGAAGPEPYHDCHHGQSPATTSGCKSWRKVRPPITSGHLHLRPLLQGGAQTPGGRANSGQEQAELLLYGDVLLCDVFRYFLSVGLCLQVKESVP